MGKTLAALAVVFGLLTLIFGVLAVEARTFAPLKIHFIFLGLWLMAAAGSLHYLHEKS